MPSSGTLPGRFPPGSRPDRGRTRPGPAGLAAVVIAGCLTGFLAGCEAPPEARFPISEKAAALPHPELGETARFGRVAEQSGTTAESIDAERAALAARAASLRARAAELSGPIIDEESLARLATARDEGIAPPTPSEAAPSEPAASNPPAAEPLSAEPPAE